METIVKEYKKNGIRVSIIEDMDNYPFIYSWKLELNGVEKESPTTYLSKGVAEKEVGEAVTSCN